MNNARQIAVILKRDGYDISTFNAAVMALQEDLNYSEEEAVSLAKFIVAESNSVV